MNPDKRIFTSQLPDESFSAKNSTHYFRSLFFFFLLIITHSSLFIAYAQPTQEWVARYVRPSGSSAIANQMALDKLGNCYIFGNLPIYVPSESPRRGTQRKYSS